MTAEIIYGIDFRAGKEEVPLCNAPDLWATPHVVMFGDRVFVCRDNDTAPSEYSAPSDDCA